MKRVIRPSNLFEPHRQTTTTAMGRNKHQHNITSYRGIDFSYGRSRLHSPQSGTDDEKKTDLPY